MEALSCRRGVWGAWRCEWAHTPRGRAFRRGLRWLSEHQVLQPRQEEAPCRRSLDGFAEATGPGGSEPLAPASRAAPADLGHRNWLCFGTQGPPALELRGLHFPAWRKQPGPARQRWSQSPSTTCCISLGRRTHRPRKSSHKVLMDWINAELLPEHIVVRSLEEDIFDGLILHHLFQKLSGLKLDVEEIALTAASQRRKLAAVLESVDQSLQLEEPQAKWSMESIFNKDLLATLHLLVALAKRFQPDLPLPTNVQVEVITMERTKSGLKSEKSVEQLTECGADKDQPSKDVFDELFKLAPEKVNAVKEAIVKFVNQELDRLGLSVQNLDTQVGMRLRGPGSGRATGRGFGRAHREPGPPCATQGVTSQKPGVLLSNGGVAWRQHRQSGAGQWSCEVRTSANQGQDNGPVK
uniref:Calponin-homology (CH) domain-containing protein n=1 Tax=Bos indicus x Bos taurus TaxID=30522 RepID=A0A4W2C1M8_BOBOX